MTCPRGIKNPCFCCPETDCEHYQSEAPEWVNNPDTLAKEEVSGVRPINADQLKEAIVEEGQRSKRYKIGEFWELNRDEIWKVIDEMPTVQPEIIRCKDCIYYDPPHVENNGVRYEYTEMPTDAFDVLGTGLVSMEYGINIGGRCCVDYYCKSYSDDKRVYVREDNYCGRAERRTDEAD